MIDFHVPFHLTKNERRNST